MDCRLEIGVSKNCPEARLFYDALVSATSEIDSLKSRSDRTSRRDCRRQLKAYRGAKNSTKRSNCRQELEDRIVRFGSESRSVWKERHACLSSERLTVVSVCPDRRLRISGASVIVSVAAPLGGHRLGACSLVGLGRFGPELYMDCFTATWLSSVRRCLTLTGEFRAMDVGGLNDDEDVAT